MHGSDLYVALGRNLSEICGRVYVPCSSIGRHLPYPEMKMLAGGSCACVPGYPYLLSGTDCIACLDADVREVHVCRLISGTIRAVILDGDTLFLFRYSHYD